MEKKLKGAKASGISGAKKADQKEIVREVIKEVIKEVPVEVIKEIEVIREVEVSPKSKNPSTAFLTDKIITVKYINKESDYIKDPKHVGYGGLFVGSFVTIPVPTLDNKKMKNILTKEEKEGLDFLLDLDLSIYGKFWKDAYKKGGMFPIFLSKDDVQLDLSDPMQYITWKVLCVSPVVANSLDQVRDKATYRFVMVSEGDELKKDKDALGNKVLAFENYVKYKGEKQVLRHILRNLGKYTSRNQKLDFLQVETAKLIEVDPNLFVAVTSDPLLRMKVLLDEAVESGVITLRDKQYRTIEGKPISDGQTPALEVAAEYLGSALGQEMRLTIEAKIKNVRE